jgi:4-amino-4-deoxy-L-arabinose transferase-like glycosyltransferase
MLNPVDQMPDWCYSGDMSSPATHSDRSSGAQGDGRAEPRQTTAWLVRLAPWLFVGGLVLFHAVNNWLWLSENVTLTGWDRPRHLAHSLNYARMLNPLTIRSLFDVTVNDAVRPPLFPASATLMYTLFGWSSDIATMVNILYMAIALAATYGIGQRWGGRWLGMVSVAFLACFPMFYAMSRHFYLEFALTAMVALTVYLLLATDGFQRRPLSLLFGLSLGLGLLTKRTFSVFVAGPLLVVILASGLLPTLWERLHERPRLYWTKALLALAGGLILAAIWFLPNRDTAHTLILGDGLLFIWWALAALAIYFVLLPAAPLSNALSALFLAASLASTWYLARVEFVERMILYGYGVNDPRGRSLELGSLDTYLFYVRRLANEHLSFLFFGLLVAVLILAAVVALRRQETVGQALHQVRVEGWVILAWIAGGYALLTFSIYQETRAFVPVLPAIALLFGAALQQLPWQRVRLALLALALTFSLVQFLTLSYEPVSRMLPSRTFTLPLWGQTSVLARGGYLELPDEGPTDRGYWIQPDILQRMENQRQALGSESLSLGLLARTRQINAGAFIYLILAEYPGLRVEGLIDRFDEAFSEHRPFAYDYVLVKGANVGANPAQEQVIEAILEGSSGLFDQAFELEASYPLPDGDTAYLYRQRYYLPAGFPAEYVARLAEDLSEGTQAGDAILLAPPELAGPFAANYSGPAQIYLTPASGEELARIAGQYPRLLLVLGDASAGVDKSGDQARQRLNQNSFLAAHEWADSLQVLTYGTAQSPATDPATKVQATLGDQIWLVGYDLPATTWQPGDIIPLTLFWQREGVLDEDYRVFVHLLDSSGQLAAQADSAPGGGSRPTTTWPEQELIVDRHGLSLAMDLNAGEYTLLVGMYWPATGERLPVQGAAGQPVGDSVPLGVITVASR